MIFISASEVICHHFHDILLFLQGYLRFSECAKGVNIDKDHWGSSWGFAEIVLNKKHIIKEIEGKGREHEREGNVLIPKS